MKTKLLLVAGLAGTLWCAQATISEPDNVVYGTITLGGVPVTALNTNVFVEARVQLDGPPIASYRMGQRAAVGDFYSLRISLQALPPLSAPDATQTGEPLFIVVRDDTGVRAQTAFTTVAPGGISRLDFNGANAGQTAHPADVSPTDNDISISEVLAYTKAWRAGTPWAVAPTSVPIAYAVRAGALWRAGEQYHLDGTVNGPPAWWVNDGTVATHPNPTDDQATRIVAASYAPGIPLTVTNSVTPAAYVAVYAVEDQPPAGWAVANISDGGVFDPVNQKVKWGLFFDVLPRTVSYQVIPPAGAVGPASFSGLASFDGLVTVPIAGPRTVTFADISLSLVGFERQPLGLGSGLRVTLKGNPGATVWVDTSTDLQTWQNLSSLTFDFTGTNTFVDPIGTNEARFYRFRVQGTQGQSLP